MSTLNNRGFSSLIVVGLVISLALGLSGLWYLNSQKVLDVSEETEDSLMKGTNGAAGINLESTEVVEIETDTAEDDKDLEEIELQMDAVDSSYSETEFDDLTY